jgi:hypothetical protein
LPFEVSPILHTIVREGLTLYESGVPEVNAAMRAIQTVNADYESYLRLMADN